jgi:uroporphyrin-III C-methyltransferase
MSKQNGKVYLIGAGPGDLDLLTLRAVRMIGQADLILIDDLVNAEITQFAKPEATLRNVGKRGGSKSTPQREIHELMIRAARSGLCVARVKGGDPFVFGRGGEELNILRKAGIEVAVANGITAGLAAPAALGIPVTHREHAHSITFITGHEAANDSINWNAIAKSGSTLVIYMGIKNINFIVEQLINGGLPANTPAAAIQHATLPEERSVLTTLLELPTSVIAENIGSPAILVIGEVVNLANSESVSEFVHLFPLEVS